MTHLRVPAAFVAAPAVFIALLLAPCASQARPNVVVVMVDDLSVNEYEAALANNVWPVIEEHIVDAGTKFTNAFLSTSLCCPTRATLLTGQHSHNNNVMDNRLPLGGATRIDDASTLPVWLQAAGYQTGLVGKYLNGYGTTRPRAQRTIRPMSLPAGTTGKR